MNKKGVRSLSAIALAALIAGILTVLPSFSDRVVASSPLNSGKGDRLDSQPLGARCSEQAWPNFDANCIRGGRATFGEAKPARVIVMDRAGLK